jgi:hypothetical protein
MNSYADITRQIGDKWVAALQRAEETVSSLAQNVSEVRGKVDLPQVEVPEQLANLSETLASRLPKPSEVVQANFELTERLLTAHRDLTLKMLAAAEKQDANAPGASEQAAEPTE